MIARPHFVAYHIEDVKWNIPLKSYRFLTGKIFVWTVQRPEQVKSVKNDGIIFELMRPEDKEGMSDKNDSLT